MTAYDDDETLVLRGMAHRMSQGIETRTRKHKLFSFDNVFIGTDAVEWLLADPKSGVNDLDGAIQVGQRMIEHGYIIRVSRELKAQRVGYFSQSERAKSEFRGGDAFYRFDVLRISPFHLHVVVRRARNLRSMDLNGKNDPYVKLNLGKQTAVTSVQLKTNDPMWNEHFVFGVNSVESQQLQLSVMDHDRFKLDDHIGSCKVGLSHLPISEGSDDVFAAEGEGGEKFDGFYVNSRSLDDQDSPVEEAAGELEDGDTTTDTETLVSSTRGKGSGVGSGVGSDALSDRELNPDDWLSPSESGSQEDGRRSTSAQRRTSRNRGSKRRVSLRSKQKAGKNRSKELMPMKGGGRSRGSGVALLGKKANGGMEMGGGQQQQQQQLNYYRLLTTNEKRLVMGRADGASLDKQPAAGELACDIWMTSFQPKPLPVQGESKFTLRCRMWEISGVTSPEERNLPVIASTVIKHKAVLMMYQDRVSSKSFERKRMGDGVESKTSFGGSVISLDFRANMATDMLKFVVQQKIAPVELTYKSVATVSIPLRSIPVSFPEGDADGFDPEAGSDSLTDEPLQPLKRHEKSASATGGGVSRWCGTARRPRKVRSSRAEPVGRGERDGNKEGEETRKKWHRLQTPAGLITARTMDNGFVVMSLALVPSGNDLLGEIEPEDSEPVKGPPPSLPSEPLANPALDVSLSCGYQRLRKALLWNDSKLQAAWNDRLNFSEVTYSPWENGSGDGTVGQENLTGCKRDRTFVIPKTTMVASTKTEAHDEVLLDGPMRMVLKTKNRTPGVPYGDKFSVAEQFTLTKEGQERCRLQSSSEAVFNDKIMSFVQGQIVTAVAKVTKENHGHMLALIEDAISGKGPGAGSSARGRKSRRFMRTWRMVGALLVILSVVVFSFLAIKGTSAIPRGFSRHLEEAVAEVMECYGSSPSGAADVSSAMEECSEPLQSSIENVEGSVPDNIFPRKPAL